MSVFKRAILPRHFHFATAKLKYRRLLEQLYHMKQSKNNDRVYATSMNCTLTGGPGDSSVGQILMSWAQGS